MSLRPSLRFGLVCVPLLAASVAVMSTGCSDPTEPVARPELQPPSPAAEAGDVSGKSVLANMDTYVNSDVTNRNYGGQDTLLIQKNPGKSVNRILVSFPQGGITDSLGADSLVSATLELTIKFAGNDWGTSGQAVALHRMTRDWLEGGATWNCANDLNVGNLKADCPGNTWSMPGTTPPFLTTPVAQSVITNGQSGVVSFDVTSDVRAFLAGQTQNQGWLLKLAAESQTGTVVFHSKEGATKPRLVLSISQDEGVPEQAPATLPSWVYASSNLDSNTAALPGVFLKDIVIVEFKPSATQSERQAAVASVDGTVVGGVPSGAGEGHYYLRVPDSTRGGGLVSAVQKLEGLPQVRLATYEFEVVPTFRRPHDNENWRSWHLDRKTLTGENWALEAVFGPMAWGCAVGDGSIKIALVDLGFPSLPSDHDVAITVHPVPDGGTPSRGDHGIGVASILAARGDNEKGMTGMMWNAELHGYDAGEISGNEYAFVGRVLQQIKNAGDDGARIVNVSLAARPGWPGSSVVLAGRGLDATLSALGARGKRPLVVLAAGNDLTDAAAAGFPRASTGTNGGQVIVVAASTKQATLWVDTEVENRGSNYGELVTVAAPGRGVFYLKPSGLTANSDGTSAAAPIVSGIAGLLLSFDNELQAADLKRYIVDGATAGGWNATSTADGEQYKIVNAHQSLKMAAQRHGAPLCGNRVWSENGAIKAQRGTGSEQLFSTGGPAGFLNVFHGGDRIDWTDQNYTDHSTVRDGLEWRQIADEDRPSLPNDPPGGTFRSLGPNGDWFYSTTHDGDSVARTQITYLSSTATQVRVQISADNGVNWSTVVSRQEAGYDGTTIEYYKRRANFAQDGVTFTGWTNTDSVEVGVIRTPSAEVRYYPSGGEKALYQVNTQQSTTTMLTAEFERCPWAADINGINTEECRSFRHLNEAYDTRLYEMDLTAPGAQPRLLHTVPGLVSASGVSEAGDEMVLVEHRRRGGYDRVPRDDGTPGYTFTNSHSTMDGCQASWWTIPAAQSGQTEERHRVQTPDMCFSAYGGGTISPSVGRLGNGISLFPGLQR